MYIRTWREAFYRTGPQYHVTVEWLHAETQSIQTFTQENTSLFLWQGHYFLDSSEQEMISFHWTEQACDAFYFSVLSPLSAWTA
jgi:hypothetical protein